MSTASNEHAASKPTAPAEEQDGTPLQRILVAEDHEDARASLKTLLEMSLGFAVDTVEDGAQALEALLARPYSILVTDIRMPRLSGLKLLEEVLKRKLGVTVIVTTGHGGVADAVNAMRMGA